MSRTDQSYTAGFHLTHGLDGGGFNGFSGDNVGDSRRIGVYKLLGNVADGIFGSTHGTGKFRGFIGGHGRFGKFTLF